MQTIETQLETIGLLLAGLTEAARHSQITESQIGIVADQFKELRETMANPALPQG